MSTNKVKFNRVSDSILLIAQEANTTFSGAKATLDKMPKAAEGKASAKAMTTDFVYSTNEAKAKAQKDEVKKACPAYNVGGLLKASYRLTLADISNLAHDLAEARAEIARLNGETAEVKDEESEVPAEG